MTENLAKLGLFFDDLNKLRVIANEASIASTDLREECRDFVDKICEYQQLADGLIESASTLATQVEREKVLTLQARNQLKCASEQRSAQQQQLQVQILEARTELERLQAEQRALQRTQHEQQDMMQHLAHH